MTPQEKLISLSKTSGLTLTSYALEVFTEILNGSVRSIKESLYDPKSNDWVLWLEVRLAQPHIGFLEKSQVNGRWGQSTTDALYNYAVKIKHPNLKLIQTGVLDKILLESLIQGSVSNQVKLDPVTDTYDWLKYQVTSRGHVWEDKPNSFNLIGIRGYIFGTGTVENKGNLYNDAIFVAWISPTGEKKYRHFVASVDPGAYYYNNLGGETNSAGCAHLVSGQYAYVIGRHGAAQYKALVQNGPVLVARTNKANFTDKDPRDRGWFGVHIHAGGLYTVDNWSAGCQVIMTNGRGAGSKYDEFISLVSQDTDDKMYYTLIDGTDLNKKPLVPTPAVSTVAIKEDKKEEVMKADKDHWAYRLADELEKEGILAGRGKNSDGSTYFGLSGPVDMGTVIALVANMIYYSENVMKVMKRIKGK